MSGFILTNQMAGALVALTTTYRTQVRAVCPASLMRRQRIVEMEFSALSVPNATDCQIQCDLTYCSATTAGTSTAATPLSVDNFATVTGDVAVSTGAVNFTAGNEPTTVTTAQNWWLRGFNQRSGVIWQTQPGREIILPALASSGALLRALSTNYVGNVGTKLQFDEL